MLNKTPHHSYIEESKLMYLADIMLRWPHLCFIKICHELFKGKLVPFVATERYHSTQEYTQEVVIIKFTANNMSFKYLLNHFNTLVFKKRNIETIEKAHYDYTFIPESKLIRHDYEMCTLKNINRVAAQLSYTICLHAHKKYHQKFDATQVRDTFFSSNIDPIFYSGTNERQSWIIPNDKLWPDHSEHCEQKKEHKKKDLTHVILFIEKQKSLGITVNKQLARLIDNFFPGFLTDREMGHLLPAQQGNIRSIEADRKQGQRLRGII